MGYLGFSRYTQCIALPVDRKITKKKVQKAFHNSWLARGVNEKVLQNYYNAVKEFYSINALKFVAMITRPQEIDPCNSSVYRVTVQSISVLTLVTIILPDVISDTGK
jgi:inner membrane protein involved in colicin E2 resistance